MRRRNWFWGAFFVLAGILVVISQITDFQNIGFWSIIVTVFLAAAFIQSLVRLNFFGLFVSAALIYIVFQKPLQLYYLSPWLLLLAASLAGIGLSMIIRPRPRRSQPYREAAYSADNMVSSHTETSANDDDNHPNSEVKFGAASRYLHSTALESGQFRVSFGSLEVFFDGATLSPGGAEIYCDCSFGGLKLYIPKNWPVEDRINATIGGVSNENPAARPAEGAPVLTLSGNVLLGGVEIQYV